MLAPSLLQGGRPESACGCQLGNWGSVRMGMWGSHGVTTAVERGPGPQGGTSKFGLITTVLHPPLLTGPVKAGSHYPGQHETWWLRPFLFPFPCSLTNFFQAVNVPEVDNGAADSLS